MPASIMKTELAFILDRSSSMESLATRAKKFGTATAEQRQDAEAPMSDIVREEDTKGR